MIDRATVQRQIDDFYACDGFNVVGDFTIRRTAMAFPDRFVIHRDIDGTLTNSVTGTSLPAREHDVITFYSTAASRSPARPCMSSCPARERSS